MTQARKSGAPPDTFSITTSMILFTGLTGCQVFGHRVDDGIWFPILLVIGFVLFVIWRIRHPRSRWPRSRWNGRDLSGSNNPGWTDGEGTHIGDGSHGDDIGDDDGSIH